MPAPSDPARPRHHHALIAECWSLAERFALLRLIRRDLRQIAALLAVVPDAAAPLTRAARRIDSLLAVHGDAYESLIEELHHADRR